MRHVHDRNVGKSRGLGFGAGFGIALTVENTWLMHVCVRDSRLHRILSTDYT